MCSYLACRIQYLVPIWQPCVGSSFQYTSRMHIVSLLSLEPSSIHLALISIHVAPLSTQNRAVGPYLTATQRILIPAMLKQCPMTTSWVFLCCHSTRSSRRITGMRILCMAAKWRPNAPFCMPNRTTCILFISVIEGQQHIHGVE
jgi:hypothetical protein